MSNMLSEPTFLRDYNAYFAVQDDLDLFAQAGMVLFLFLGIVLKYGAIYCTAMNFRL